VKDAVQLVASEASRRRASLEVVLPQGLPPVDGDAVLLLQLLLNLLLNALDAIEAQPPGKRRVSVRAVQNAGTLELSVRDSGPGLSQAARDSLFQPFFTTKPKGLGMGLAICQSIAEAHQGTVVAESGPEGGAVFRLTLPVRAPRREAAA